MPWRQTWGGCTSWAPTCWALAHGAQLGAAQKKDMGPPACRPAIHRRRAKGRLQCVLGGSQWHKPWQTDSWQTDGLFSAPSGWGKGPDCDLQLCTEQQYLPLLKSMGGLLKSAPPGDSVVYWETSTLMWETTLRPGGVWLGTMACLTWTWVVYCYLLWQHSEGDCGH